VRGPRGVVPGNLLARALLFFVGTLLLAGCVTVTAGQQQKLDDWRGFADRVVAHYKASRVTFLVGKHGGFEAGTMRPGGLMTLTPAMLDPAKHTDFLLAHELAHWVLGHSDGRTYPSLAEAERVQIPKELDANAEAVKILMVGRSWSERTAFQQVHAYIWSYKRLVDAGRTATPRGHPEPCVEINDLIRRFPQHADMGRTC
jgi:hypothetical protein